MFKTLIHGCVCLSVSIMVGKYYVENSYAGNKPYFRALVHVGTYGSATF